MIILYTSANSSSCHKARSWFHNYGIPYDERNISSYGITRKQLFQVLVLTKNGTSDVISTRSYAYQQLKIDLNQLSFDDFVTLVCHTPALLRTPIIVSKSYCQIGFNKDDIRSFVPHNVRQAEMTQMPLAEQKASVKH